MENTPPKQGKFILSIQTNKPPHFTTDLGGRAFVHVYPSIPSMAELSTMNFSEFFTNSAHYSTDSPAM
jgi:hypothetical protein